MGTLIVNQYLNVINDPYFNDVSLYLKGDGANGSTAIVDSSLNPKDIGVLGGVQISTTQRKYGVSSILFGGSGDYLSLAEGGDIGVGDFAVESWVYPIQFSGALGLVATPNTNPGSWVFGINTNRAIRWFSNAGSDTIDLNSWSHVAVTRETGTVRIFLNGVLTTSLVDSSDYFQSSLVIGTERTLQNYFNGYIDSLRITKGVARYTANFNPVKDTYLAY